MLEEDHPHQSCTFHQLVAFRLDVTEAASSSCRGSEDTSSLPQHARDVFYSPNHPPTWGFLMRKSECHKHYLISSDWESTHRYTFATHSANCVMRQQMSCPIRKQCRRHSTSTPLSGDVYRYIHIDLCSQHEFLT